MLFLFYKKSDSLSSLSDIITRVNWCFSLVQYSNGALGFLCARLFHLLCLVNSLHDSIRFLRRPPFCSILLVVAILDDKNRRRLSSSQTSFAPLAPLTLFPLFPIFTSCFIVLCPFVIVIMGSAFCGRAFVGGA